MRILDIHNRYLNRGGEDESFDAEVRMLREGGEDVEEFVVDNRSAGRLDTIRGALRTIWNPDTPRRVEAICRQFHPDVAVVHNFFPLVSPTVYRGCARAGVPVAQHIENYRLFCPVAVFHRAGHVCEDCLGWPLALPGVVHRCYRRSFAASLTVALMSGLHRALGTWRRAVDRYIAVSEFTRQKCVAGGLPPGKLCVKPNFVHPEPRTGDGAEGYVLFVGRLVREKGLETLLDAWMAGVPGTALKIVGDGPEEARLKAQTEGRHGIGWLGRQTAERTSELMAKAAVLVFPTLLYETFGRVVIEAYARGTPVIASRIGAVAELVEERRTGYLFPPGDTAALAGLLRQFFALPAERRLAMRAAARSAYEAKYTPARNYVHLMEILESLVSAKRSEAASP